MITTNNWILRFLSHWGAISVLFALSTGAAPPIHAQIATTTASISGTITDPTGAVLPRAVVNLVSSQDGISRTFTTENAGRYTFTQLPPSTYTLSVKAKGFKIYEQTGLVLNASQSATQDVSLTVGSETESVMVVADAAQLNTDNSNVAADIPGKDITEYPLNIRNVYSLASLNSSVSNTSEGQMLLGGGTNTTDDADQDISFMNFAGGFFGSTGFMLDGSWDTDTEWGGVIFVPSVDAVQEFKVQNNSFTAQYGWSTGNVVNVVTKSGTNAFHGRRLGLLSEPELSTPFRTSQTPTSRFRAKEERRRSRRPALHSQGLPAARKDLHLRSVRAPHHLHSDSRHLHGSRLELPKRQLL